jgi:hypothetical protein
VYIARSLFSYRALSQEKVSKEFDLGHRSGRILTWDIVGAVPPDILAIPDVAPFTPIGILPVRSAGKPPSSKNTKPKVRANDKQSIDT